MSFYQSKSEFYKSLIDIHKKCGQGLSGIVRVKSDLFSKYLDELIEEGLVKCCDTGGSIGHPESNRFYCPTKGYCVWDEDIEYESSYMNFSALTCVRLYLNILDTESVSPIQPTITDVLRNPNFMETYSKWLSKNEKDLKEMIELSDVYLGIDDSCSDNLSEKVVNYVKTRSWYKDNLTVANCISQITKGDADIEKEISLLKEIISLKKRSSQIGGKFTLKDFEQDELELKTIISGSKLRPQIKEWLKKQDSSATIQTLIK
jgi:hypothetical protein